ncbi:MAG: glycosyltransferase family 4 protein [Planctomycetes bacterium]|nr:glycosyltransferase family 4 protein [Planctomycetota bacterium]
MRIVQLAPGSGGGFYCENCIRDAMLVRQLHRLGHEAVAVPMYLPGVAEQSDTIQGPVFFGGINVWLQQHLGLFRKTPRWVDRWFDRPGLLRMAAKKAAMVNARELGRTTISMLEGADGRQVKELDRLLDWLAAADNKPDVVILSNALLAGLAGPIRRRLDCTVACLLQDEDGFVDGLGVPWAQQVWELMRQCAADVDLFIAVSRYYKTLMAEKLSLKPERIQCVYPGLDVDAYQPAVQKPETLTIGFLSRMCKEDGLDILVDAIAILAESDEFNSVRLKICGGQTAADISYVQTIREKLQSCGLAENVEWVDDFGIESRKSFLQRISLMCVPVRKAAAYGLCVLEAMACGVGFVEPKAGVFEELAQLSGAGVLYEPNEPAALAEAIRPLLSDRGAVMQMGQKARQAIESHFDIRKTSQSLIKLLEGVRR